MFSEGRRDRGRVSEDFHGRVLVKRGIDSSFVRIYRMTRLTEPIRAISVPLTAKVAEKLVAPAAFEAVQVYSPACLALTASMVIRLTRFPVLDIEISP